MLRYIFLNERSKRTTKGAAGIPRAFVSTLGADAMTEGHGPSGVSPRGTTRHVRNAVLQTKRPPRLRFHRPLRDVVAGSPVAPRSQVEQLPC